MNILILGGVGYIGSEVATLLTQLGNHNVLLIDILLYEDDYLASCNFMRGDVSDYNFMAKIFKKNTFDSVIHLAGIVGDEACRIHQHKAYAVNVKSVQILKELYNGKIVFPSSCSVYGSNDEFVDETSKLNPLSYYAQNKVDAEKILEGTNSVIYRFGTLHGISGRFRNDLVVNTLILKAIVRQKMTVFGGDQWRPLIHVKDVAETIVWNLSKHKPGIYNLFTENLTIIELAKFIKNTIPKTELVVQDIPYEDNRNYKALNDKIQSEMSLCFKRKVENTVKELLQLHIEGRVKDYSNIKYCNIGRLEYKI